MKRLFITLLAVFATLFVSAQDVIFTVSGDSIMVNVLSVGVSEVTYKKWDNLNGPIYTLPTSEISIIQYMNGTSDYFNAQEISANDESNEVVPENFVWRYKSYYIVGEREMTKLEFQQWLKEQQCWEAYNQLRKGRSVAIAGWALFGCGVAEIFGVTLFGVMGASSKKNNNSTLKIGMGVFGGCLLAASIPTLVVGYKKMHGAVDVYNVSCMKTASAKPYWSLQASSNGLGLALNF